MAYDLAVLGAGPGGYQAAIRATQLGMKVVVVERDQLGGVCGNWGCIPTKALLRSAELVEALAHAAELGITVEAFRPDFTRTIQRSRQVADKNAKGVEFLFKKNKIETLKGAGKLVKDGQKVRLAVDGKATRPSTSSSPPGRGPSRSTCPARRSSTTATRSSPTRRRWR
jgi:dihydrolipoamide dehydrogenase